ncbi:DUF3221 domain-containing protein [Bacillus sp. FJAT-42315]|uniref:DUF3221 domain-containing protein n=1 Tax=Bacillus sp. FJAT-42315 TaxID=2014077 RepID=UPI000C24BF29|nr:DUF3221 domain-containing protein [Bacillus sp. FJAT-42315]
MNKKLIISTLFLLLMLSLLGCSEETPNQQSNTKKESESTKNLANVKESVSSDEIEKTIGYIEEISSDTIKFRVDPSIKEAESSIQNSDSSDPVIFKLQKVDENISSKLKAGQKVKVTHYSSFEYSDPLQGTATDIEILEES